MLEEVMRARTVPPKVFPGRLLSARIAGLFARDPASDKKSILSTARETLDLGFEGIVGDSHAGFTRKADARTPRYPRGTPIRNVRQVSLVSVEELADVARRLGVAEIRPEWLGANLLIEGLPPLSFLPTGSRLYFQGEATLIAEGYNPPCVHPGKVVQRETGHITPQAFVKAARRRRGIVATVERPGRVAAGETITVVVPDQWIY